MSKIVFTLILVILTAACAVSAERFTGISTVGYSIQVGAFSDVRNAERLTAKLQEKGIEAFYFKRENGLYAVRFGDYRRRDDAGKGAKKLVSDGIIGSYFIAPPQMTAKAHLPQRPERRNHEMEVKPQKTTSDMGYIAARTAERFVGIPYRWGGNTVVDGMDCSGFARAVYNLCGVNIPRTSGEQFKVGLRINQEELMEGDLVFFGKSETEISHVGVYVGGNQFVHAPKRGEDIKISSMTDNNFAKRFMGGRRYF